jgi:sugar transferase (PEP-CTERM/EpsH1 system associated)
MTSQPRPVHIMHVVRVGQAGGGMENGIINVANGLPADQFRVSICALDSQETFSKKIRRPDSAYYLVPKKEGIEWLLIWRLVKLFLNARVDVVHSHNWGSFLYAVLAARLAGIPIVHGEHGKNLAELNENNRPKLWAKRILGRSVDRLVTVSQAIAAEWADHGIPRRQIECIPNGVDVERFQPRSEKREFRRSFGLPEGGFLIGSVGRLDPIKDYETLVSAFAPLALQFPESYLAFLGNGPCEPTLRARAASLGISDRIFWPGRRPDPQNFLASLDIFVLPSVSEGMSNVVLEAMASGLPVVCADLLAHREVFAPNEEGLVFSPGDAQGLTEVLAALVEDPERRAALGAAAHRRVLARFNLQRMIGDYERLYARYARPEQNKPVTSMAGDLGPISRLR